MTEKRFTNIEHDYENAWIKCNDNGEFMIYAIYKELDESLPSLEDLLNGLSEENEQLRFDFNEMKGLLYSVEDEIEKLEKEKKELKELIDLFAQDICDLTELLCKNNIDYTLHSDVTNFITKWGIRND